MTYQEKVARAEECFELIKNGYSFAQIKAKLEREGLYQYDISKVLSSVNQMLDDKFGEEIYRDVRIDSLSNINKYNIHDEVYQDLKATKIIAAKGAIMNKIAKFVAAKKTEEEIITHFKGPLITESEILEKIQKVKIGFQNKPVEKKGGNGVYQLVLGIILLVVFLIGNRISFLAIGLIIYGLYKMFTQNKEQDIQSLELEDIGKE